jgi:hypothetical protein
VQSTFGLTNHGDFGGSSSFHGLSSSSLTCERTAVERRLGEQLVAAVHAVFDQELFVHRPHASEAGGASNIFKDGSPRSRTPAATPANLRVYFFKSSAAL